MFSSIFSRKAVLALITVLTIGLFSIPLNTPASATPVTINLTGTVGAGSFIGTVGTGTLNYDSGSFTGLGTETIGPGDGLTLSFNIFGQTFTGPDDIDYNLYPQLTQQDGFFESLDFIVSEVSGSVLTNIIQAGVFGFSIFFVDQNANLGLVFDVEVDEVGVVPLPAALPLFGTGLALMGFIGWRRKRLATA